MRRSSNNFKDRKSTHGPVIKHTKLYEHQDIALIDKELEALEAALDSLTDRDEDTQYQLVNAKLRELF